MKIANKVKTLVLGASLTALSVLGIATPVNAIPCPDNPSQDVTDLSDCGEVTASGSKRDLMGTLNTIINVVIGVIGFVAVIVIILGGVNYTTSAGAADKVKQAKDTIMYGIVGLVIALLAFAIVNFVLKNVFGS